MTTRSTKPLADSLRDLLTERGLTQTDLWVAAGVSPAVLSRYLKGERGRVLNSRSLKTVEKLATALGVDPDYFLEYRQVAVASMAAEAMAEGIIEPQDFAAFLEQQRELRRLGA